MMLLKKMYLMLRSKILTTKYLYFTNLATNTTLNPEINEVKNKLSNINNLATTSTLNAKVNKIKNKIPTIGN